MVEQKRIHQKRLAEIGFGNKLSSGTASVSAAKRDDKSKKITDYFSSASRPIPTSKKKMKKPTIHFDNGVEIISLSDSEPDENNNDEEADIKFKVDEDVEIVEWLPPIPLRDHPVHEIND